jgi:hypothetical protein
MKNNFNLSKNFSKNEIIQFKAVIQQKETGFFGKTDLYKKQKTRMFLSDFIYFFTNFSFATTELETLTCTK